MQSKVTFVLFPGLAHDIIDILKFLYIIAKVFYNHIYFHAS